MVSYGFHFCGPERVRETNKKEKHQANKSVLQPLVLWFFTLPAFGSAFIGKIRNGYRWPFWFKIDGPGT